MALTNAKKKTAVKKTASKSSSRTQTVSFLFDRSTKGTHRFIEEAEEGQEVIGTLYVKKSALGDTPPSGIVLRMEVVK